METKKERSAKLYYNRKNNGLCPRCGNYMDRNGGYYCSECLKKVREYRKENRRFFLENHLCTECGKVQVFGNEHQCPECRAKRRNNRKPLTDQQRTAHNENMRNHQKTLYQQRSDQGICTRCGKRKAIPGKKKCGICLQKDAEFHKKKNMNKPNIREYRESNHLCYYCGNPIESESGKLCNKCLEKCRENGYKSMNANNNWKQDNRIVFRGENHERNDNHITVPRSSQDDNRIN